MELLVTYLQLRKRKKLSKINTKNDKDQANLKLNKICKYFMELLDKYLRVWKPNSNKMKFEK
jgi:hypothetical protein